MESSERLEAPLVDNNDGTHSWWRYSVVKIAVVTTACVAIALAGFFLTAPPHGEAVVHTHKSVPEILASYPKLVSVKHVNEFFERLPAHDMEELVFQHIKPNVEQLFLSFLKHFGTTAPHFQTGKKLSPRHTLHDKAEFSYRLGVFEDAFREIISLNNFEARENLRPDRAIFAVNKFTDWTWDEYLTLLKGPATKLNTSRSARTLRAKADSNLKERLLTKPPCSRNWAAEHPSLFKARDQGACGACFAFAAAEEIRTLAFLNTGVDPGVLSVQYIIDCKGDGCKGGDAGDVMNWVNETSGIPRDVDYGLYMEHPKKCKPEIVKAVTTAGADRYYNEEKTAKKLCADGPLSMGLYANNAFHRYHSGVLSGASCQSTYPNHDTQVVGVFEDKKAFMIRNSWGADWGVNPVTFEPSSGSDGGFILLEYGKNTCDITDCNSFPMDVSCIGDCNDHPTPPPTTPPPEGYLCSNTCRYADDGACDDGGPGSSYSICTYGSDCDDCDYRPPTTTTTPASTSPTPTPEGYLCSNTCRYSYDHACDDGGSGSTYSVCTYGSDCHDCGARAPTTTTTPVPTPAPTPAPEGYLCNNQCHYADDDACDDGGPGSTYSVCDFGTDCDDCGARAPTTTTTRAPTPPPTPAPEGYLCNNTCHYADDGACDDGGHGSTYSVCTYGSDCDDCGARAPIATTTLAPTPLATNPTNIT